MAFWGQLTVRRYPIAVWPSLRVPWPELALTFRRVFQVGAVLLLAVTWSGGAGDGAGPVSGGLSADAPAEPAARPAPAVTLATVPTSEVAASSTVETPATVASSWSAPPAPVALAPAPPAVSSAVALVERALALYGVSIVLDGQDWGADEASQVTNIGAVLSALERLPASVRSAVMSHRYGPLTFVSNSQGRTLGGWQPYGGSPMGFYTNSDRGADGVVPANQVVLIPGFSEMSIAHEILHAYQFRNIEPEQYALAMLGDEMRSFAQATGWRQVGTDEQVRQALNQPWSALDALYVYEGRPLTYTTGDGATGTLEPPNPIEAFAMVGSLYYTRPSWLLLPEWPEYWAWFDANLG